MCLRTMTIGMAVLASIFIRLQGLYFLRSDVDSRLISCAGDVLTDFRFHRAAIELKEQNGTIIAEVASKDEGGCASITVDSVGAHAPDTGLFKDSQERERLLKYHPLGLAIGRRGELRLAEVFRDESAWRENAVAVVSARWGFFDAQEQAHLRLERATRVVPLDYKWRIRSHVHQQGTEKGLPWHTPGFMAHVATR